MAFRQCAVHNVRDSCIAASVGQNYTKFCVTLFKLGESMRGFHKIERSKQLENIVI